MFKELLATGSLLRLSFGNYQFEKDFLFIYLLITIQLQSN